jgi:hypothetical protein
MSEQQNKCLKLLKDILRELLNLLTYFIAPASHAQSYPALLLFSPLSLPPSHLLFISSLVIPFINVSKAEGGDFGVPMVRQQRLKVNSLSRYVDVRRC